MALADVVKMRRRELGMNQPELAYAMKVSPTTVSLWERGVSIPNFKNLEALSKILGVSERDLLFPPDVADVIEENEDSKNVQ